MRKLLFWMMMLLVMCLIATFSLHPALATADYDLPMDTTMTATILSSTVLEVPTACDYNEAALSANGSLYYIDGIDRHDAYCKNIGDGHRATRFGRARVQTDSFGC